MAEEFDETKFPEPVIDDGLFYSELYEMKKVDDWVKRCLADSPYLKPILEAEPMPGGISRTFQALLCLNEWRVKWFDQFKKKEEAS